MIKLLETVLGKYYTYTSRQNEFCFYLQLYHFYLRLLIFEILKYIHRTFLLQIPGIQFCIYLTKFCGTFQLSLYQSSLRVVCMHRDTNFCLKRKNICVINQQFFVKAIPLRHIKSDYIRVSQPFLLLESFCICANPSIWLSL